MYSILGIIFIFHLGALILPGPDFAVSLRYSLINGRKSGIVCAFGIAIGVMINALISFLIGQTLHKDFPILYKVFILLGLIYLMYLGIVLIRNYFKPHSNNESLQGDNATTAKRPFMTGVFTNVSNVKAIVFFNSILPLVNHLNSPFKITAWIGIGILTATWFSVVACLFSHAKIRNAFLNKINVVEVVVGSVLILFSLAIFYNAIL